MLYKGLRLYANQGNELLLSIKNIKFQLKQTKANVRKIQEPQLFKVYIGLHDITNFESMDVQHDIRQRKFYTVSKNTEYSLEYNELDSDLWEFHCSYVPEGKKEHIVEEKLIEYAVYYMRRNRINVFESGSCHHVKDFLDKKSDLKHLIKYT